MLSDDERPSLVQLRKIGRDLRQNLHKECPPNTPFYVQVKILGLVENFRLGGKIYVWAKILCSGENFMFGRKFYVRVKILGLVENFRLGGKF